MIYEVSGDILLTRAEAIAHAVAPNDHFDQGLALALREKWPALAKDFRHYSHQCHPKPGELWTWGTKGIRIFNLMTQEGDHAHGAKPGKATLANANHALKRLRHELEAEKIKSLALPKLSTGVGGLDWAEVLPVIRIHLSEQPIPIFIYSQYKKGVEANEPGL